MKINQIKIYGSRKSIGEFVEKLVFDLDITKPINVFCLENGAGKSTLFLILKHLISLEGLSKDLTNIILEDAQEANIIKVLLSLSIGEDSLIMEYKFGAPISYFINGELKNKEEVADLYYKNIFNQKDYLYKLISSGSKIRKSTVPSFARSFFFGDDTYYHRTEDKSCNLIDNHQDGPYEKMIFFYYLLGENLDGINESILSMTASYTEALQELDKVNSKLKDEGVIDSNLEDWLLDPLLKYKAYQNEIGEKQEHYRNTLSLKTEAELALDKINDIYLSFNGHEKIKLILQKEIQELTNYIQQAEKEIINTERYIDSLKEDADLMSQLDTYNTISTLLKRRIFLEKVVADNIQGRHYLDSYEDREKLLRNFEAVYKRLLDIGGYGNADINMSLKGVMVGDLRLKLKKGTKLGDAHLRIARVLILTALQIYNLKYDNARLTGVACFDAAMDGVSNKNIVNFFDTIIKYYIEESIQEGVQLFYFFAKASIKDDEVEEFLQQYSDLVYIHKCEGGKMFDI